MTALSAVRQAHGTPADGEHLPATPGFNQGAIPDRVRAELAQDGDRIS